MCTHTDSNLTTLWIWINGFKVLPLPLLKGHQKTSNR
nr:MAG TPA: hypothetical protein [Crassvirales sp.]